MCLEDKPWQAASSQRVHLMSVHFGVELTGEASTNVNVKDKLMNLTTNHVKIYIN